jgi:TonB family protein
MPELPRVSVSPARPQLKTDNLSESRAELPNTAQPNAAARKPSKATGAFDSAPPPEAVAVHAPPQPATARGGFGDATAAAPGPINRVTAPASPLTSVEILFKPRPAYTDEARRLQIQGEVLLQIFFLASGEVRIDRVVRGLGHGLDESASAAARGIRFRPARRDGTPVDFEATVHIVFELAY